MSKVFRVLTILCCSAALALSTASQTSAGGIKSASNGETAEAGKIRGVVTYYFNDNFGDKGDVGATIFLVSGTVELPPKDSEVHLDKESVSIVFRLSKEQQKQNKAATKSNTSLPNPPRVLVIPVVDHTTVDVNGAFQFDDVPAGKYTVIIQSSHTREAEFISSRDRDGRLACVEADVKSGRAADASYKFPATGLAGAR